MALFQPSFGTQTQPSRSLISLLALLSCLLFFASLGTWLAGRYQIVKLDDLKDRYWEPVTDYGSTFAMAAAQPQMLERDLLDGCKQSQIGTWLQTTDALGFIDPIAGNRVLVRLDPSRAFVELNGRDISGCIQDEIENLQFDIGSQTSSWAVFLLVMGAVSTLWTTYLLWALYRYNRRTVDSIVPTATSDPNLALVSPDVSPEAPLETPTDPENEKP